MIGVKRNTGMSGSFFRTKIYVDGQEVAKIKEGQQIELEIPNNEAKIYVSQFENHSNELIVQDGQVVEITNSAWFYLNFVLMFIAILLVIFFIPFNYRFIGLLAVVIVSLALSYFKNGFDLKIIAL